MPTIAIEVVLTHELRRAVQHRTGCVPTDTALLGHLRDEMQALITRYAALGTWVETLDRLAHGAIPVARPTPRPVPARPVPRDWTHKRPVSPETRAKMAAAARRRWTKRSLAHAS